MATTEGLVDGGLAGLFWSYVWTWLGFSTVMASLAEMASMSVAAGQYPCHRIPSPCRPALSFFYADRTRTGHQLLAVNSE